MAIPVSTPKALLTDKGYEGVMINHEKFCRLYNEGASGKAANEETK